MAPLRPLRSGETETRRGPGAPKGVLSKPLRSGETEARRGPGAPKGLRGPLELISEGSFRSLSGAGKSEETEAFEPLGAWLAPPVRVDFSVLDVLFSVPAVTAIVGAPALSQMQSDAQRPGNASTYNAFIMGRCGERVAQSGCERPSRGAAPACRSEP